MMITECSKCHQPQTYVRFGLCAPCYMVVTKKGTK